MELDPNPRSTIGKSEKYKQAWHEKYGEVEPKGNAKKQEWVDYALANGASEAEVEDMTVTELKEAYEGSGVAATPSQGSSLPPAPQTSQGGSEPGAGSDSGTAQASTAPPSGSGSKP